MAVNREYSAKATQAMGLPENFRSFSCFPFGGINRQASPLAMPDGDFQYVENFVKLGDGNFRTLWDVGVPAYRAPSGTSIIYYAFFTLASNYYVAVFLADGSAVQVNMQTLAQTPIGPAGTFYQTATGDLPYAKQWGSTYLLISNRNTKNDYWIWDGKLLYGAGTAAPNGVLITGSGFNYSTVPTVTAVGGSGSGMQLTAIVDAGSVTQVQIDNPGTGYQPGDVVLLQFAGGGSDTTAVLQASLATGGVGSVSITFSGSGYTSTPAVAFSGGGGSGAAGTAITYSEISNITVTNPGSGYATPVVSFTGGGGGFGAAATANLDPINPGQILSITITDHGTGYTTAPTVVINDSGGGGGINAAATAYVTGVVIGISVTVPGSGYTSAPTVSITGGGGSGATAISALQAGTVGAIAIINGGSGFTAAPTLTLVGGGGSGATATCTISGGVIDSVTVTAPGSYYTSAPAVQVGAGLNNAAAGTVALMPFGISGACMETFLSRVWIADPATVATQTIPPGNLYSFSAAGSPYNFSDPAGGGGGNNTDAFLQTRYVAIRQSSGYLYFYGDGSVSVVSNVLTTTAGTTVTTNYNYQNVDPQAGLSWRDSIQDFGRSSVMANETGVYGLYGGAATKVSAKLDQFLTAAVYPAQGGVTPSSAVATIFNVKHYLNLVTIPDPDTGKLRNVMVAWNEKDWVIASQSVDFKIIATQKVESRYYAWGSDGQSIYPMFVKPSTKLQKRFWTKTYGVEQMHIQKQLAGFWMQAQDNSADQSGVGGVVTTDISTIGVMPATPTSPEISPPSPSGLYITVLEQPEFLAPPPGWSIYGTSIEGAFSTAAIKFSTTSEDFTLGNLLVGYMPVTAYYGIG